MESIEEKRPSKNNTPRKKNSIQNSFKEYKQKSRENSNEKRYQSPAQWGVSLRIETPKKKAKSKATENSAETKTSSRGSIRSSLRKSSGDIRNPSTSSNITASTRTSPQLVNYLLKSSYL